MPKLSIIVVSYNTRGMTLACLQSVYAQTRETPFELLVIDNASADGSAEAIADAFPQARLWPLNENLGFAAGNNFAAQHANGDWLLLLNPDTVVLDGAIDRLVAFAERAQATHPQAGIFGGRTLFADGSLNPTSCWAAPSLWSTFCIASGLTSVFRGLSLFNPEAMPDWRRDTVREVDIVTGCFFLLRRSLWERLGGFDPSFFMYGEEADLCLRARKLGVRGLICPEATIIHYGGASESVRATKMVRLFRAKAQLFRRHWPPAAARVGIRLLDCWAWTRKLAFAAGRAMRPRYAAPYACWSDVLRERAQWRAAENASPGHAGKR